MQISDETLMALADGELDDATARAVTQALQGDADLAARYRLFAQTRQALRDHAVQTAPVSTPGPDPLAALIRASVTQPAAQAVPSPTAPTPTAPANLNRRPWLAAAASMAVAALGLGWWGLSDQGPAEQGGAGLSQAELAALNALPSGESQPLADGGALTMIASFTTTDGGLCREYETDAGDTLRVVLACREDAQWRERFAATSAPDGTGYVPASGEGGIDDALSRIGASAPLSPQDEAAALTAK